jgi:uncharacterized MAPEG superfamily protein
MSNCDDHWLPGVVAGAIVHRLSKEVRRINVELDRVKTGRAIDTVSQDRVSEETIRNLGKLCADHNVMARTNAWQALEIPSVMTIPVWVLLGFAAWTLLTLFTTIGVYRWTRILTGRASIAEWRADEVQGTEWYRRALRAHMNCVENLPVYTATVVVLLALRLDRPVLDALAITILVARICQTSVHLSFDQTNPIAAIRFAFFFVQAACMIAMGVIAAVAAGS